MSEDPEIQRSEVEEILNNTRTQLIKILMIFGICGSILSPLFLYFFDIDDPSILFNAGLFIIALSGYLAVTYTKRYRILYWVFTVIAFFVTLFINFSPKIEIFKSDATFTTVFPFLAIFLLGRKYGIIWSIIYFLVGSSIILVAHIQVNRTILYQLVFSGGLITLMLYFYQSIQEKAQDLLRKHEGELKNNIQQINEQKKELERMNNLMVGREITMTELKKEIERLKGK